MILKIHPRDSRITQDQYLVVGEGLKAGASLRQNIAEIMKKFKILLVLGFLSFTCSSFPSQVRVDSTGGLSLVMTDETADVNPYNLGNPAGMILLSPQIRLQFNPSWYSVANANNSAYSQNFALTASNSYEGFLDVGKDWAFQSGGSLNTSGTKWIFDSSQGNSQNELGFVQGAATTGPFNFGANVQTNGGTFTSDDESFNQSATNSTIGLLVNVPLASDKNSAFLRLGGSFLMNIGPEQTNYFFYNPVAVTDTYKNSINVLEPCVFLDIQGSFQAGAMGGFNSNSNTETTNSSNPSVVPSTPTYLYDNDNIFFLTALYKWKITISPKGNDSQLSFNNGFRLDVSDNDETQFQPDGSNFSTSNESTNHFQFGLGLEREKDFTFGVQGNVYETNSTEIFIGQPAINHTFTMNQISVGGEKWISPNWTLRLGLMYENDNDPVINGNGSSEWEGYYEIYPGQEVKGTFITAGLGYEDKILTMDGRIFFEQPQSFGQGLTGPEYTNTLLGAELSMALFLE